jgi:DUF4097 and DUF4098 domain-containing protein YvlB
MIKLYKLVAVCAVLVPFAAAQQTSIHQDGGNWTQDVTGSLAKTNNVIVKTDIGSVRVTGGAQANIDYAIHNHANTSSQETAKRQFDSFKVTAYVSGDTAWIIAEWEGGQARHFGSDFVITVPNSTEQVKVESESGNIEVVSIAGRTSVETGGGGIKLENIGQEIQAQTGGGNVEINAIGGDATIETGGGNLKLGSIKGKVSASTGGGNIQLASSQQDAVIETGAGSIHVQDCGGMLKVSTGGGDIDLGTLSDGAQVETGGGSIHLSGAKGYVRVESGSGHIELDGVPSANVETGAGGIVAKFIQTNAEPHDSRLETTAGDITVYLAPSIHIVVDAAIEVSNGHSIQSDFPEFQVSNEGGPWGTKRAEGNLNGGGPLLKIRTTNGNIVIHRSM